MSEWPGGRRSTCWSVTSAAMAMVMWIWDVAASSYWDMATLAMSSLSYRDMTIIHIADARRNVRKPIVVPRSGRRRADMTAADRDMRAFSGRTMLMSVHWKKRKDPLIPECLY